MLHAILGARAEFSNWWHNSASVEEIRLLRGSAFRGVWLWHPLARLFVGILLSRCTCTVKRNRVCRAATQNPVRFSARLWCGTLFTAKGPVVVGCSFYMVSMISMMDQRKRGRSKRIMNVGDVKALKGACLR